MISFRVHAVPVAQPAATSGGGDGAGEYGTLRTRKARRPPVDAINAEEEARIRELIAANTWPRRWTGEEPLASEPYWDSGLGPCLFADDEE